MGVFERLLRRSKATEEAPAVEAPAVEAPAVDARGAVEAEGSSGNEGEATARTAGATAAEDTGIPRQQTPEEAADNEADKGSRT
uniref:Gliding motility protein n=1 Tax=Streptomyces sp. NBC_01393 TaxID=2903851 RepID=A0AAU3I2W3_9ACTN